MSKWRKHTQQWLIFVGIMNVNMQLKMTWWEKCMPKKYDLRSK